MFDTLGRITELREEQGLSLYALAKKSNIPQSTLATWFAKDTVPTVDMIEKICGALGISLSLFFSDDIISQTKFSRMRKMSGLTSEELAKKVDISVDNLIAYENNKKDLNELPYGTVKKMADILNCRTEDLI